MKPERHQRIGELYHEAQKLAQDQRAAFLAEACAGDEGLRREVESLLALDSKAESFIESPALEILAKEAAADQARSLVGKKLDRYEILALLGAGGMGEVYRARDSRLGREVAVKVLPAIYSADADRLRRFEQEARAAGMLNHPNILTLHDVGTHEGSPYIITELLEGETLRGKMKGKALPLGRVMDYAMQIARGLAAAHARHIVHRDLKPENLFITGDGRVKILDFGLAKLKPQWSGAGITKASTESRYTAPGTLLGTVGYMSPEQVRGEEVDHRSDIFAFGAVLYEMIAGRPAFQGESAIEIMNAILKEEPPEIAEPGRELPRTLVSVMRRCLDKNPENRFQSISDLAFSLEMLSGVSRSESPTPSRVDTRPSSKRAWPLLLGSAGAIALVLLVVSSFSRFASPIAGTYRFTPLATEAGEENYPAWAPDGKTIAYVAEVGGVKQIFARSLGSPAPAQITRSSTDSINPFWSPDGAQIYYHSGPNLWSVGAAGGEPQLVIKAARAVTIAPDGKTFAFIRGGGGNMSLWLSPASEAAPQHYRTPPFPENFTRAWTSAFSRDGSKIAVLMEREGESAFTTELWIVPFPSGSPHRVLESLPVGSGSSALHHRISWVPDNRHLVLNAPLPGLTGNHLYKVDTERRTISPITSGTDEEWMPSVSPDGDKIAFSSGTNDFDVVQVSIDGSEIRTLLGTSRREESPAWSPSGRQFAYVSYAAGGPEIWVRSVPDGWGSPVLKQGTEGPSVWYALERLIFSPDGQKIAYGANGSKHAVWISPVGGGRPVPLDMESYDHHAAAWSPDGNWIAYQRFYAGKWEIVKKPLSGGKPVSLAEAQAGGADLTWSPTGEWLLFRKANTLQLVSADAKVQRTLSESLPAAFGFSKDGSLVYSIRRAHDRTWVLVAIDIGSGKERKVADLRLPAAAMVSGFSLHPDGKSFVTSVGTAKFDIWLLEGFKSRTRWWSWLSWAW